jgi:hypothetical protein
MSGQNPDKFSSNYVPQPPQGSTSTYGVSREILGPGHQRIKFNDHSSWTKSNGHEPGAQFKTIELPQG